MLTSTLVSMPCRTRRGGVIGFAVAAALMCLPHSPAVAQTEEPLLDLTQTPTLSLADSSLGKPTGWRFSPNADATVTSVEVWQNRTSSDVEVTLRENVNNEAGPVVGSFTFTPRESDTNIVGQVSGDDFFSFRYEGSASVNSSGDYWLVVDPNSFGTKFAAALNQDLVFAPNTPGRPVTQNVDNFFETSGGNLVYSLANFMSIYVLNMAVATTSTSNEPIVRRITFGLPPGLQCNDVMTAADQGVWMRTPSVSDCAWMSSVDGAGSSELSQLLGWATTPDFPVELAKRQVNNGWGAYELTDDDGAVTGVFIPAGAKTHVSADATLYAILS